jgi:hypothetical protein
MNIRRATQIYEAWLSTRLRLLGSDLKIKHQKMTLDPFSFLRATFYRWVQVWPKLCPELASAPAVQSVGDLHVENFGTWRDAEGRLIWGVNDFDEAFELPYTQDLTRLATSALVAIKQKKLSLEPGSASQAILEGYTAALVRGGCPFVLSERHGWLRDLATNSLRDPTRFWEKFDSLPSMKKRIPHEVMTILQQSMPERGLSFRVVHRRAGLGSLGRQRFTALGDWQGGKIAREAKELCQSVCGWDKEVKGPVEILYARMLDQTIRAKDPLVNLQGHWLVRRLSPYCCRIELSSLPRGREEQKLLQAMGWETANIHMSSRFVGGSIKKDLKRRGTKRLRQAAEVMAKATHDDWQEWSNT